MEPKIEIKAWNADQVAEKLSVLCVQIRPNATLPPRDG